MEGNELITISKWEEKESDVNIATRIFIWSGASLVDEKVKNLTFFLK